MQERSLTIVFCGSESEDFEGDFNSGSASEYWAYKRNGTVRSALAAGQSGYVDSDLHFEAGRLFRHPDTLYVSGNFIQVTQQFDFLDKPILTLTEGRQPRAMLVFADNALPSRLAWNLVRPDGSLLRVYTGPAGATVDRDIRYRIHAGVRWDKQTTGAGNQTRLWFDIPQISYAAETFPLGNMDEVGGSDIDGVSLGNLRLGYWSEVIAADEPTADMYLLSLAPDGGAYGIPWAIPEDVAELTGWETTNAGAGAVNDIGGRNGYGTQATHISTGTARRGIGFTARDLTAVSSILYSENPQYWEVRAVKTTALAQRSTMGGPAGLSLGLRTNDTNVWGPRHDADPAMVAPVADYWHVNPATGAPWTHAEIDALILLVRSET